MRCHCLKQNLATSVKRGIGCRFTGPGTSTSGQWDHHLQTYHTLDATWVYKKAEIEALELQRQQQLEEHPGRATVLTPQPQASTLSKALDLVQQLKWDEMEQESKKAVREVELAASLAQLRVASDRRQVAVQSVPKPEPSWAAQSRSMVSEDEVEAEAGVVDLLSSSEDEGVMQADQVPDASGEDGVVDLLSSDNESAGSEDGEAATEASDASMSDEELRIDVPDRCAWHCLLDPLCCIANGSLQAECLAMVKAVCPAQCLCLRTRIPVECYRCCRILTQPLRTEYRRLTTEIHGHEAFVVHPRARVGITGEDIKLCAPGAWVGDACINMYMALLQVCTAITPHLCMRHQ